MDPGGQTKRNALILYLSDPGHIISVPFLVTSFTFLSCFSHICFIWVTGFFHDKGFWVSLLSEVWRHLSVLVSSRLQQAGGMNAGSSATALDFGCLVMSGFHKISDPQNGWIIRENPSING